MRRALSALLVSGMALASTAQGQFVDYFDVSKLTVPSLNKEAWGRRMEDQQLRYICIDDTQCKTPTGITIKGVTRAEKLEDAFATGELSPAKLLTVGKANAERSGSEFMEAKAITIGGVGGVHMEAATDAGGKIYFVTKFIGRSNTMLDIKVTSPDLLLARKLSDEAAAALSAQMFKH